MHYGMNELKFFQIKMMPMTLWGKGYKTDRVIMDFTVGDDYILDQKLVKYDCIGSIAHFTVLNEAGILNDDEYKSLKEGLKEIMKLDEEGKFKIRRKDEDCNTAIEKYLTRRFGEVGKKIHTGRSRNDQSLTALRLYEKEELRGLKGLVSEFQESLQEPIGKYGDIIMPGYTHTRKAMPTNVKTWLGSFVESSKDNKKRLDDVYNIIDQSPLGSAAGFGVPGLDLDKDLAAKIMGFSKVMDNPIYAQASRGKFESDIINMLKLTMLDLNILSTDLMLFSMDEFGYVSLPDEFCTGSSIMPHKKNPDVLELVRAKYHVVLGEEMKVSSMLANRMSGYGREMQLTKEPLINSMEITKDCLGIMCHIIPGISINKEKCAAAITEEMHSVEKVLELVKKGMPLRDAYKEIAKIYE